MRSCAVIALIWNVQTAFAAGPQFADIPAQTVPVGKSLVVPVQVDGAGPMTFTVSSSNSVIVPLIKTGEPYLKMHVDYAGNGMSAAPFSGDMVFQLFRDLTPKTVGFIAGFAQAGFYNNEVRTNPHTSTTYNSMTFSRISQFDTGASYFAQGGDPDAQNPDASDPNYAGLLAHGVGFSFENEFRLPLIFSGRGQLAMANAGTDQSTYLATNNSSFFIMQGPERHYDFAYTIFGQIVRGFDVLDKIIAVPVSSTKPTVDVVITNAALVEDSTDCVLLVGAAGLPASPVGVTITAKDANGVSSSKTFTVTAVADTVNDPPIINPPTDFVAPPHQVAALAITGQDLEFDYLFPGATYFSNATSAPLAIHGNVVTATPNGANPRGLVTLGLDVQQFGTVLRSDVFDRAPVSIGLGDARLTPQENIITGAPGTPLASGTVGSFGDADPFASSTDFTTTINWGDDSPVVTGSDVTLTRVTRPAPSGFAVSSAPHTYANPGIYPVSVVVRDALGATAKINETAVITNGPLIALGRTLTAGSGLISNRLVATFSDSGTPGKAGDYTASINWGDGTTSTGKVRTDGKGFGVYGTHAYKSNLISAIDVTVTKTATLDSAHAWSTAQPMNVSGNPLPPYAQAHVVGNVGDIIPNTTLPQPNPFVVTSIYVVNSGNKTSGPLTLKFYLSADQQLDKASDLLLKVGLQNSLALKPLGGGQSASGSISDLRIPSGTTTKGKYLIMEIVYSDPIGDHEFYPRYFSSVKLTH